MILPVHETGASHTAEELAVARALAKEVITCGTGIVTGEQIREALAVLLAATEPPNEAMLGGEADFALPPSDSGKWDSGFRAGYKAGAWRVGRDVSPLRRRAPITNGQNEMHETTFLTFEPSIMYRGIAIARPDRFEVGREGGGAYQPETRSTTAYNWFEAARIAEFIIEYMPDRYLGLVYGALRPRIAMGRTE